MAILGYRIQLQAFLSEIKHLSIILFVLNHIYYIIIFLFSRSLPRKLTTKQMFDNIFAYKTRSTYYMYFHSKLTEISTVDGQGFFSKEKTKTCMSKFQCHKYVFIKNIHIYIYTVFSTVYIYISRYQYLQKSLLNAREQPTWPQRQRRRTQLPVRYGPVWAKQKPRAGWTGFLTGSDIRSTYFSYQNSYSLIDEDRQQNMVAFEEA